MKEFYKNDMFKTGIIVMLYFAAFIISAFIFGRDFPQFFGWWWTLIAAGIIFFPVSFLIFKRFRDCGILFSVVLGVAFMGWLSWMLASLGAVPFNSWGCMIVLILCAVLNIAFLIAVKKVKGSLIPADYDMGSKVRPMLVTGLIFLAFFIVWNYIRGFRPDALSSTESVMDYAYMKSLDRANYMPAVDMWMAGKSFNYYYVGQYIATFLSKISGVGVGYGYNFMLMTEASLAFMLPYSLVSTVFADFAKEKGLKRVFSSHAAGIISGIAVTFCGNFHYLIFYYVVPALRGMLGVTDMARELGYNLPEYFFPNSTRYIGYLPKTADKTIHEFPAYTFVLGDLHAHVINIMFVLCVLGILYAYITNHRKQMNLAAEGALPPVDKTNPGTLFGTDRFFSKVFDPHIIVVGFFIGLFHATNFWDYPIYFVVAGAVILYVNFVSEGIRARGILLTVFHAAVVVIVSKLVCLPFTLSFDQISSEIGMVTTRTPLYQFLVLWGFPYLVAVVFIVIVIRNYINLKKNRQETAVKTNAFCGFLLHSSKSNMFVLILVLCAMGLCLIPEIIYVKDIYSGDFKRANTMFKITYQAFIIFGISFGYIFAKLLIFGKKKARVFASIGLCLLLLCAGYSKLAIDTWYVTETREFKGLSSDEFLEDETNDVYEAIRFLDEHAKGRPVIIEANGDSYTDDCCFSAWTGLPTVLGWKTHEWLWRSSGDQAYPKEMTKRDNDIRTFYTTDDMSQMQKIIDKYDIRYVIIGLNEWEKFGGELRDDLITRLGTTIFENESVRIIEV